MGIVNKNTNKKTHQPRTSTLEVKSVTNTYIKMIDHRVIGLALLVATIYVTGEVQETESGLKIEFVEKPTECDQGAGDVIPGGATLHFDIELLGIEDGPPVVNVFKEIDSDGDLQVSRDELNGYLVKQVEVMKANGGQDAENVDQLLEQQDKLIEEIFSHDDKDKDGYISHEEFSGPKHDEL